MILFYNFDSRKVRCARSKVRCAGSKISAAVDPSSCPVGFFLVAAICIYHAALLQASPSACNDTAQSRNHRCLQCQKAQASTEEEKCVSCKVYIPMRRSCISLLNLQTTMLCYICVCIKHTNTVPVTVAQAHATAMMKPRQWHMIATE